MGDVLAYEGRFKEASKFYQKADEGHRALAMYTDMRMFDLAQVKGYNIPSSWDFSSVAR